MPQVSGTAATQRVEPVQDPAQRRAQRARGEMEPMRHALAALVGPEQLDQPLQPLRLAMPNVPKHVTRRVGPGARQSASKRCNSPMSASPAYPPASLEMS